jgi:preprotein translocase subunit SecG
VIYLLYALHILVCVFLIFVVLLQQGKGADLSVFGGGTTQTAFGARGATTLLHKLTVGSFVVFVLTTLAIGLPQLRRGSSVMGDAAKLPAKTAPAVPGTPAPAPAAPAPAQR